MENKGLIHVYYGYGKGKTTAAFGLALRASGYGKRVFVLQFLKSQPSGEVLAVQNFPNIEVLWGQAGESFSIAMTEEEKQTTAKIHNENLANVVQHIDEYDMLILDECIDAYQLGLLDEKILRKIMFEKPEKLELIITGHKAENWILEQADYVTQMQKEKHPYDKGILARKGIEY